MKQLWSTLLALSVALLLHAQEPCGTASSGKVSAVVYSHINYSLDGENNTAFEVKRAYFGYKRNLDEHFSAEVKLDIGSIDDDSEYALIRRYTYFKNAYLSYRKGNVKTWFGLMDMLQFKVQEKFWGYRYLYKSFMDEHKFGSSADLGTGIQYTPSEILSADLVLSNGEGYKNLQFDNRYRVGFGITLHPVKQLTLRGYYTVHTSEVSQMSVSGFVGYKLKKLRIGGEYNYEKNDNFIENRNRYGYSLYSTYIFYNNWELFARYDQIYSNILPEEEVPWNLAKDGSAIIAGIQYSPIENIHMALNYQDWVEYAGNGNAEPYLYLSLEVLF